MKQQTVFLPRRALYSCLAAAAVLMLAGSFADYPLSCALYNPRDPFAIFFAAYGEAPATLGWVAAGTLLLRGRNPEKRVLGRFQCGCGVLLIALGTLMICVMPGLYLSAPPLVLAAAGLALSACTALMTLRLARGADRRVLIRVATAVFLAILCELVLVNLIKVPWGRARMRLVASDPRAHFMPWWQAGGELKRRLMAAGVAAEEFKSFPSGHTANAAAMLLLGLVPLVKPRLQRYKTRLLAFGFVWAAVVAFTRIVMGAHYLTDTVIGFLLGFLSTCLFCSLTWPRCVRSAPQPPAP